MKKMEMKGSKKKKKKKRGWEKWLPENVVNY